MPDGPNVPKEPIVPNVPNVAKVPIVPKVREEVPRAKRAPRKAGIRKKKKKPGPTPPKPPSELDVWYDRYYAQGRETQAREVRSSTPALAKLSAMEKSEHLTTGPLPQAQPPSPAPAPASAPGLIPSPTLNSVWKEGPTADRQGWRRKHKKGF